MGIHAMCQSLLPVLWGILLQRKLVYDMSFQRLVAYFDPPFAMPAVLCSLLLTYHWGAFNNRNLRSLLIHKHQSYLSWIHRSFISYILLSPPRVYSITIATCHIIRDSTAYRIHQSASIRNLPPKPSQRTQNTKRGRARTHPRPAVISAAQGSRQ